MTEIVVPCQDCAKNTYPAERYMVTDTVWAASGMPYEGDLCFSCLERRLGRLLRADDFTGAPINDLLVGLLRDLGYGEAMNAYHLAWASYA